YIPYSYPLSLHDVLPILQISFVDQDAGGKAEQAPALVRLQGEDALDGQGGGAKIDAIADIGVEALQYPGIHPGVAGGGDSRHWRDRKSTRLNSSHVKISY